jgi:dihydroxyacid dehydratase/phosphogluconate dehydratase
MIEPWSPMSAPAERSGHADIVILTGSVAPGDSVVKAAAIDHLVCDGPAPVFDGPRHPAGDRARSARSATRAERWAVTGP